jgi:tetratricopeptide (TPR) repeat protein
VIALEHLQAADAELPGGWLVQEHVAAVHDRLGEHGRAIAIYEGLLEQRALPQLMDALAAAYQHAGQGEKAAALIERADVAWRDQIARMPEAAMGHGLEHELQFGSPTRALELAVANVAMRPGGDAQVGLARAYLKAGRMAEALAVIEGVLGTPYRTAGVHDVAAKAYAGLGMVESARGQEELREGIHPAYVEGEHVH